MADLMDSQTAVIFAIAAVIIIWLMSFPNFQNKKKKDPWDFHF
ncbi:MAG: hypothetical protein ABIG96_02055 [Candidatus Micrarchaeota archaeon]